MTARLFDPIELLSPVIIRAKLIIQELWQLQLAWDETVPIEIHTKWLEFHKNLKFINKITIPRFMLIQNATVIELHGFADASEVAYGACIYVKSIDKENGLIRVGGGLKLSDFPFDKRHSILLPKSHHVTRLIFLNGHLLNLHAGPTLLLNIIRIKFWPIIGRNIAKQTVRSCMRCFRYNPKNLTPIMGNLPSNRVTPMPPLFTTGVDYAGPISIKNKTGRGCKLVKCYISVFVCFSTKAIHLEPVTSLSTSTFLAALRRFVARRGKPMHMYSDNGTNFQGANNELNQLHEFLKLEQGTIAEQINNDGIDWHFIPPHSPHFGGLWEAGVKSTKYHLKRVLGDASLTLEELYTVLTQIEVTLNSRPLSPMSSDPNDLLVLTPAHFLIGRPYTALPDSDVQDIKINRLDRYQFIQRLNQQFWNRWCNEYISQLQQKCKWKSNMNNVSIGSLVLFKDDNLAPCHWKLGRVTKLHPGKDSVVRVVSLKCASEIFKRPVVKICMLPVEVDN